MTGEIPAALIKKQLVFNLSKVSLELATSNSLFSSVAVDAGTAILLNSLRKNRAISFRSVLDLGCGYGPIGLFLKAQDRQREVQLTDRDALAVAFTEHNAALNGLNVTASPSLDLQAVESRYSLIATNFPAKMEEKGLLLFTAAASNRLDADGILAMVVVRELKEAVERVLRALPATIAYQEHKAGHSVFHISFDGQAEIPSDPYHRGILPVTLRHPYELVTARGIPEFDQLSYATRALLALLLRVPSQSRVCCLEPGQGVSAIAAADILAPASIVAVSRDLLALRFTELNCRHCHKVALQTEVLPFLDEPPESDLILWALQREDDVDLHQYNLSVLERCPKHLVAFGDAGLLERVFKGRKAAETERVKGGMAAYFRW